MCVCRTLTGGASLPRFAHVRAVASRGVALAGPVAQQPAIGSKGARIFIAIVCILALTLLHVDMLLYSRTRTRTREDATEVRNEILTQIACSHKERRRAGIHGRR